MWWSALMWACVRPAPPVAILGPEDVTEEALNGLVAELVPLVEAAAGRAFDPVPHCRLGRAVDLQAIVAEEFRTTMGRMFDVPDWVVDRLAGEAAAGVPGVIGKYGLHSKVLYVAPDAVRAAVEGAGLDPARTGDVVRLILAHEMAHALQDQHATLFTNAPDTEALDAERAVTEGHANLVERRVADALGLRDVQRILDAGQGWTDEAGPLHPGAFDLWAFYGQGRVFMERVEAERGVEGVWATIASPPRTTTPLFRDVEPRVLDVALPAVEADLSDGSWVALPTALGELPLRRDGQALDADALDDVLAHVVGGVAREAFRSDRAASAWLLEMDDPTAAAHWLDLWAGRDLAVEGADRAVLVVQGPPEPRPASSETHAVWLTRGRFVAVVRAQGFRPGNRMDAAVERLLAAIPPSNPSP